jgi:hypothetical protein
LTDQLWPRIINAFSSENHKFGRLDIITNQHMNEVLSRWEGADIRRRDGGLPVWDLGRPGLFAFHRRLRREAIACCRRQLLNGLLRGPRPVFLMHEPPEEYEVPGQWQRAGEGTWVVPPDLDIDHPAVAYWLFALGNWRLYWAPAPAGRNWPDAFRCAAVELLAWMRAKPVSALIESYHDGTDWVVALGAAEPRAEADGGRDIGSS